MIGPKLGAVKRLVQEVNKWPDDSKKVYASISLIKTLQGKYEKILSGAASQAKLPATHVLENEATAANILGRNLNKDTYPVSQRLLHPTGMYNYYQRIIDESNKGAKKTGFFRSIWDTTFGYFK